VKHRRVVLISVEKKEVVGIKLQINQFFGAIYDGSFPVVVGAIVKRLIALDNH